jgi:hypothetical protein
MDDLAPAPAQRTSDDGGRRLEQNFMARKKAVKKVQPTPAQKQDAEPDLAPEAEPEADPESDHQLDLLA